MKIIVFALLMIPLVTAIQPVDTVCAAGGCCKFRQSFREPWQIQHSNFQQCKQENDKNDRDNVYLARGRWWWDSSC